MPFSAACGFPENRQTSGEKDWFLLKITRVERKLLSLVPGLDVVSGLECSPHVMLERDCILIQSLVLVPCQKIYSLFHWGLTFPPVHFIEADEETVPKEEQKDWAQAPTPKRKV